ncbi:MAG: hypothetical protein QM758_08060 [Armatimonas sp.]
MSHPVTTKSNATLEMLDALASAANAAQDQALQMARTATEIHRDAEHHEVVETLATQLQGMAIDIQLRLQMIQDAAVKLGAKRPINSYDAPVATLRPGNTPAARRLLDALASVTLAAQALDEEMGWLNEDGKPNGYYERYTMAHLLLQTELEDRPA